MRNNSVRAIALAAALPLVALTGCTTEPSVTQTTGDWHRLCGGIQSGKQRLV